MKYPICTLTPITFALAALIQVEAQTTVFNNAAGGNNWNNAGNWSAGIADNNGEIAQMRFDVTADGDFIVNRVQNEFTSSGDLTVSSDVSGSVTIDTNSAGNADGIRNVSGQAGGSNLRFSGNVTVDNTLGGATLFSFGNNTSNAITFTDTSVLTVNSLTETNTAGSSGYSINFNGSLEGTANLRFGATDSNITFGATSDNSNYNGDFVFFANSAVVSDSAVVGGFVASEFRKIQVNGSNASLTLNGAGSMLGNVVVSGTNSFTFNVNANQDNMGTLDAGGVFNLNVGASVTELFFADSSSLDWTGATVAITGFKENTISFGTNADGLTEAQLGQIDGGIYSLTAEGFLTIPEPGAFALIFGGCAIGIAACRRRRS